MAHRPRKSRRPSLSKPSGWRVREATIAPLEFVQFDMVGDDTIPPAKTSPYPPGAVEELLRDEFDAILFGSDPSASPRRALQSTRYADILHRPAISSSISSSTPGTTELLHPRYTPHPRHQPPTTSASSSSAENTGSLYVGYGWHLIERHSRRNRPSWKTSNLPQWRRRDASSRHAFQYAQKPTSSSVSACRNIIQRHAPIAGDLLQRVFKSVRT